MHEFGHNLGLYHGGDENTNYKPNYLSVMNYLHQLQGLPTIGDNEGDRYYLQYDCTAQYTSLTNPYYEDPANFVLDYSNGSSSVLNEISNLDESIGFGRASSTNIDFNCNGTDTDVLVDYDLNRDSATTSLTDHDDWSAIEIIFATKSAGQNGIQPLHQKTIISVNPVWDDIQPTAQEEAIDIPTR
jgi:hypothetical protein